jgi:hypothetical protein
LTEIIAYLAMETITVDSGSSGLTGDPDIAPTAGKDVALPSWPESARPKDQSFPAEVNTNE